LGLPVYDDPSGVIVGEVADEKGTYYQIRKDDWQKRALNALERHGGKTSVRTANGAGKTSVIIPGAVFWFMTMFPRAKVVITSGVDRQVREQIFPSLRACAPRLEGWTFSDTSIDAPNGSHAVGFTTKEGGYFEGWHGNKDQLYKLFEHDGPLLIVVDEAKSVIQDIFDAIDRCTYQHLLYASSCGAGEGEFHASHTKNARFFQTVHAPAAVCPHADHAKNLELIQKRGLGDPLVRSKVFAEFMTDAEGSIVSRSWIDRALQSPPRFQGEDENYFCDFAAGGDENVLAARRGNRVRIVEAWRDKDTMAACGRFILLFRRLGLTPERAYLIGGDNSGLGKPVIDRMHELGWQIRRENNGEAAQDSDAYMNYGAETWWEGGKQLSKNEVILEGIDEATIGQMCARKGKVPSSGKLGVESKEDMKKRGVESPDRADAVFGAMRKPKDMRPIHAMGDFQQTFMERAFEEAGINSGGVEVNFE
jgi:hypothetical protein